MNDNTEYEWGVRYEYQVMGDTWIEMIHTSASKDAAQDQLARFERIPLSRHRNFELVCRPVPQWEVVDND